MTNSENNADYVVKTFTQVKYLIFSHGFNAHRQLIMLIYFYFYKNVILVSCEFVFQTKNSFTQNMFFMGIFISVYNLVWTTLQSIIAILSVHGGVFQSIEPCSVWAYRNNSMSMDFRPGIFWAWIISACSHGFIITNMVMLAYQSISIEEQDSNGIAWSSKDLMIGQNDQSTLVFVVVLQTVYFKLLLELEKISTITSLFIILTIGLNFLFLYLIGIPVVAKFVDSDVINIGERSVFNLSSI